MLVLQRLDQTNRTPNEPKPIPYTSLSFQRSTLNLCPSDSMVNHFVRYLPTASSSPANHTACWRFPAPPPASADCSPRERLKLVLPSPWRGLTCSRVLSLGFGKNLPKFPRSRERVAAGSVRVEWSTVAFPGVLMTPKISQTPCWTGTKHGFTVASHEGGIRQSCR